MEGKKVFGIQTQFRNDWMDKDMEITIGHVPDYDEEEESEIIYEKSLKEKINLK